MLKIIHCADLHLDSKMESNLDKDQAYTRRQELIETFERMVDYAVREGVRAILIAGDLFDKSHVRGAVKKRVAAQIIWHPEIDFYYLKGNHDKVDFMEEDQEKPANFHTFTDAGFTSYQLQDVVISGMELSPVNSATIAERLVLDSAQTNIVMLHGQQSDYDGKDGAEIINIQALKGKYIDYLALGHVHKYTGGKLDDRGIFCYSGCLEGRGFDETGDKGFVLLEIEDGHIDAEFIPFATRRLHEFEIKVTPDMDNQAILNAAGESLLDVDPQDMVKFVLAGERELDDAPDVDRIVRYFGDKYFFVKCYDHTRTLVDYDSFAYDKSLKGEFVRLVQADESLSEEKKATIVELGIRAIMGEDI